MTSTIRGLHAAILILVLLSQVRPSFAQTLVLRSPTVEKPNGKVTQTVLFRPSDTVNLKWDRDVSLIRLKVGVRPGDYSFKQVRLLGSREAAFTPEIVGLPVGLYYGILTNSSSNSLIGIQQQSAVDPSIEFTSEFVFAVESQTVPRIIGPRGTVATTTPTFEWEAIPGVVAYALIISSTPFRIGTDPVTGWPSIEGVNLVWAHLTTNTSATYGELGTANTLLQFDAAPLVQGQTYNYSVLNAYSKTDGAFLSTVFGSVVAFNLEDRGSLSRPILLEPRRDQIINRDPSVRFSWEPVGGALSYTLIISERLRESGSQVDVQIFQQETPNSIVDIPARELMRTGEYIWSVTANDAAGAASISETGKFRYETDMGSFTFVTHSAQDQAELLGVSVTVRSTDGGYHPTNAFVNLFNVSHTDSLVVGNYDFLARKEGYADSTFAVRIRKDERTNLDIQLRPLSSRLSGFVNDSAGLPVADALVTVDPSGVGTELKAFTGFDGSFSLSLAPGSYMVQVTKSGYSPSVGFTFSIALNEHLTLPEALVIQTDNILLSGRVTDQDGIPISLVKILATGPSSTQEIVTAGDGSYLLALSEGSWEISTEKAGFFSSAPRSISLVRGDNVQHFDFLLTRQASRVSGHVNARTRRADGTVEFHLLSDATVTATPIAGLPITVQTDFRGNFDLNLAPGSYSIQASADGHADSESLEFNFEIGQAIDGVGLLVSAHDALITGRAVSIDGSPVESAHVSSSSGASTFASAGGRFSLSVPAGLQDIVATADGFVQSVSLSLAPGQDGQLTGVVLRMRPNGALISGQVLAGSRPLTGTVVRAVSGSGVIETTTDNFGKYRLGLASGSWLVHALSPRFESPTALSLFLQPGQKSQSQNLILRQRSITLEGYVTDGFRPVSNVDVFIENRNNSSESYRTITLSDGTFALAIAANSSYTLRAQSDGSEPLVMDLETGTDGSSKFMTLKLIPHSALVSGRVLDLFQNPVANAEVGAHQNGSRIARTETDPDGSFSMGVEPGSYAVRTTAPGYSTSERTLTVAAGEQILNFDLFVSSSVGTLVGSVLELSSSLPIAGATITVESDGIGRTVRTAADGLFVVSSLPGGVYSITPARESYQFQEVSDVSIIPGSVTEVEIRAFNSPGRINGSVVSGSGSPISGASILAWNDAVERSAVSNESGSFSLIDLPVGSYQLGFEKSGFEGGITRQGSVTLSEPALTLDSVTLREASGVIAGLVRDGASGRAIFGALVSATGQEGSVSNRSDSDGRFLLEGLLSADYTLTGAAEGYSKSVQSVSLTAGTQPSIDIWLGRFDGTITGTILDEKSQVLPFKVSMVAVSDLQSVVSTSDASGRFTFTNVAVGVEYNVSSNLRRAGYGEVSGSVNLEPGTAPTADIVLRVPLRSSQIQGSAGVSSATVVATNLTTGQVAGVTESLSNGVFNLRFLPAGRYRVQPTRLGYDFSPPFGDLTVGADEIATMTFTASPNIGRLGVTTIDTGGSPMGDVRINVTSADRTVVLSGLTDVNGVFEIEEIPLNHTYRVSPVDVNARFFPDHIDADFITDSDVEVLFTGVPANSFVRGAVQASDGTPIDEAVVTATSVAAGRTSTVESRGGSYVIGPLTDGDYDITVTKVGFAPVTIRVTVLEGQQLSSIDFILLPLGVNLTGRVLRRGIGAQGVAVSLISVVTRTVSTGDDGTFRFDLVPLEAGETAVFEIRIDRSNRASISAHVQVLPDQIGSTINVPTIVLPSSRITLTLSDGENPVPDVRVVLTDSNGEQFEQRTNELGVFETPANLDPGSYTYHLSETTRLSPKSDDRLVILAGMEEELSLDVVLPFEHLPIQAIVSDLSTVVTVSVPRSFDATGFELTLRHREIAGGTYSNVRLVRTDTTYSASLPAPGNVSVVEYLIDATRPSDATSFATDVFRLEPLVAGRLKSIRLNPEFDGVLIRKGQNYRLDLILRDGLGSDLTSRFQGSAPEGSISWTVSSESLRITQVTGSDPTMVTVSADDTGSFLLGLKVVLNGVELIANSSIEVVESDLEAIILTAPEMRVFNESTRVPLTIRATLPDGRSVEIGNGLAWSVTPQRAGHVTDNGLFVPADPDYIGPVTISARDADSGQSATLELSLFARIDKNESRTLVDKTGADLFIPSGAVPFIAEIGVTHDRTAFPKKFVIPHGQSDEYTVGDRLIRYSVRSDRALPGDSLNVPATLRLSTDTSLRLRTGEQFIALFNPSDLRWHLLPTSESGGGLISESVTKFGEYGVISKNERLGIKHAAVLPTPFSPNVSPLKIGYLLETLDPPVRVTIRIMNVRGDLVRTLFSGDLQYPGRYGSNTGLREILWDGLTDRGKMARNGRYLIVIEASDQTGTVSELLPVVLVK